MTENVTTAPMSQHARAFALLHQGQPTRPFISNLDAEVPQVEAGPYSFPATLALPCESNAWVVSPATT